MNSIDTTTDYGTYILGILWGTMAIWEEGFWLRHKDRFYVSTVCDYLDITAAIQEISARTGLQYRVKIVLPELVKGITELLKSQGWSPRQAQERQYPSSNLNDKGFIRAWVELHSSAKIGYVWNKKKTIKYSQKKLIVYGNWLLLEEMNYILSSAAGLEPRTIQKTSNEITKAIYYQGKAVDPVVEWLYRDAEIWNPIVRRKLEFID